METERARDGDCGLTSRIRVGRRSVGGPAFFEAAILSRTRSSMTPRLT